MQTAEREIIFSATGARRPDTVVHFGAPSSAMAATLDAARIETVTVERLDELDAAAGRLGQPTVLVGADRWSELHAHPRAGRTVFVALEDDDRSALAALDDGADDVVMASDTAAVIRAIVSREPLERPVGDGATMHAPRLAELSAEMAKLARALDGLVQAEPESRVEENTPRLNITAAQVRALIRARRARGQYFAADLFADPAWDILLDLMASRLEGRQVSVSSLCIAAAVPATTALRWIKSMTDAELLQRKPDPIDGRRVFIDLSQKAVEAMNAYMENAPKGMIAV